MSQYKVGDVASLFPTSSLQSLFKQHTKKLKKRNVGKQSEVDTFSEKKQTSKRKLLHESANRMKEESASHQSSKKKRKLADPLLMDTTLHPENACEETFSSNKNSTQNNDDLLSTLFIGNLPLSLTKKMLQEQFQLFGPLKTIRFRGAVPVKRSIPKKVAEIKKEYHEGLKSHIAYVVFNDRESASSALSLNGTLMDGHHIVVDFAKNIGEKKMYDNDLSVFIGSLPYDVSDEEVWSIFEEVHAVRVIRDKATGLGKGIGYVQFKSAGARKNALRMEGVEIRGRTLRVKPVNQQKGHSNNALMRIRTHLAHQQSRGSKKKSVKKLLKKGRREHKHKKVAQVMQKH